MQDRGLNLLYDQAEPQGGYFSTRQATGAGVSSRLLTYYTGTGDIERIAHGVYRLVRFPAHRFGHLIAEALWAGPDSAVSHDSALAAYGLAGAMPPVIHLTVPRPFRGKRPGVAIHHQALTPAEVTVWDDVPVTTVERTIADVATTVDPSLAVEATQEATKRGLTTHRRLISYLDAHPDGPRLRRLLGLPHSQHETASA